MLEAGQSSRKQASKQASKANEPDLILDVQQCIIKETVLEHPRGFALALTQSWLMPDGDVYSVDGQTCKLPPAIHASVQSHPKTKCSS